MFSGSGPSTEPLGAVVMSAEADDSLFPMLQDWPIPSDSGETLLVRRQGDQVLYLNELRQQKDTALNLTIPLSRTDLPAVAAVLGQTGIFAGRDYRGVEVIASLRSIPDSPWYMVAKMDRSEAFAGETTRMVLILALAIVLIIAVVAAAWTYWQLGQKRHYREAYEREKERLALLSRFEHLMKQAGDAILVSDEQARIVEANDSALAMYGYSREEILGLHVTDTIPPEGREAWEARREGLREKGSMLGETVHLRKDGTRFPVEVSSRMIGAEGERYWQAIVRDITERKRAEEEIRELSQRLAYHMEHSPVAVIEWGPDMRLTRWSGEAERMFGWHADEVLGKRIEDFRWVYAEDTAHVAEVSSELQQGTDPSRFSTNRNYRKDGLGHRLRVVQLLALR